jgi:hypothetical protein
MRTRRLHQCRAARKNRELPSPEHLQGPTTEVRPAVRWVSRQLARFSLLLGATPSTPRCKAARSRHLVACDRPWKLLFLFGSAELSRWQPGPSTDDHGTARTSATTAPLHRDGYFSDVPRHQHRKRCPPPPQSHEEVDKPIDQQQGRENRSGAATEGGQVQKALFTLLLGALGQQPENDKEAQAQRKQPKLADGCEPPCL